MVTDVLVAVAKLGGEPDIASDAAKRFHMTKREIHVATLLICGARNDAIARSLGISPHTVRRNTERIFAKVGATSRVEAAARLRA